MKQKIAIFVRRLHGDESGAVVALVAIAIVALIGLGALGLDVGSIAWSRVRLQTTTDLAAISGAARLSCTSCTNATIIAAANSYSASAASGGNNVQSGLVTNVSATLVCLTTIGSYDAQTHKCLGGGSCGSGGCNAIEVQQQTTVPFTLGQVFGFGSVTLTATSWAAKGGALPPMHIMMVLDTTGSMTGTDPTAPTSGPASCGGFKSPTRLDCALAGLQTMLAELWPSQDEVGLIVFPPVSLSNYGQDYQSCSSSSTKVTTLPYGTGPGSASVSSTYQIVGLAAGYRNGNTGSLEPTGSSSLVSATCQGNMTVTDPVTGEVSSCTSPTCTGVVAAVNANNQNTYLAGAITEAQNKLSQNSVEGVQNVIIVLSDGGAGNAYGTATTSASTAAGQKTLTFPLANPTGSVTGSLGSAQPPLVVNSFVCDQQLSFVANKGWTCPSTATFPANTVVTAIGSTTVTLSNAVKTTVGNNKIIYFSGYNECNASILAAQAAAKAGTWVYSIAYQSYMEASPQINSCSDVETTPIANVSSCATMRNIANSPGSTLGTYFQDDSRFFSDPMGLTAPDGPCTSLGNPNATDIVTIFTNLGLQFAALIPVGTQ